MNVRFVFFRRNFLIYIVYIFDFKMNIIKIFWICVGFMMKNYIEIILGNSEIKERVCFKEYWKVLRDFVLNSKFIEMWWDMRLNRNIEVI